MSQLIRSERCKCWVRLWISILVWVEREGRWLLDMLEAELETQDELLELVTVHISRGRVLALITSFSWLCLLLKIVKMVQTDILWGTEEVKTNSVLFYCSRLLSWPSQNKNFKERFFWSYLAAANKSTPTQANLIYCSIKKENSTKNLLSWVTDPLPRLLTSIGWDLNTESSLSRGE